MTGVKRGLIFDIQGFSVHDGPGCRTLVFLSGCPLRCLWCANPEGLVTRPRLLYRRFRCACEVARCSQACLQGAILSDGNGGVLIDRKRCESCKDFVCVKACYREALVVCGSFLSTDEVMAILRRDRCFWGEGGGVTLGGGDPLAQFGFSKKILAACQAEGIDTAVETSGYAREDTFLQMMRHVRWAFIDIKHMDPQRHMDLTGVDNRPILGNIQALCRSGWEGRLVIRLPVVPGYNDDRQNLRSTAEFVSLLGLDEVQALPFHRLGESKYRQLGLKWDLCDLAPPSAETLAFVQGAFAETGVQCYLGYDAPF